jgi:hypothetical protein
VTNNLWTTWFDTVNGLMGAAAQTAAAATGARGAATDTPAAGVFDLWKISMEQYERAAKPWAELTERYLGFRTNLPCVGADPLADIFERSFGLLADFPGLEKELPTLVREAGATWASFSQAMSAYNAVLLPTWLQTGDEILREVQRRAAAGKPVDSAAGFLALATSVTDRVLVETFRSERYVQAHRALSDAIAKQRLNQGKIVDLVARGGHFPTRRDFDEALREIATLKRELRALQRSVRAAGRNGHLPPGAALSSAPAESDAG